MSDAKTRWDKENAKHYGIKVMLNTEADIAQKLDNVDNRSGYIKNLIREDIKPERRYAQIAQKVAADIGANGFRILQRYAPYIKTTEIRQLGSGFVWVTYLDEHGQIVAENSGGLIDWYPMIGEIVKI